MNYLPIINVKRIAFGFGLFFGLLTVVHSQESIHRPDLSGEPMLLYFRLGKALVDNGYMDNARTLRHLDEVLSDRSLTGRIDSTNILSFASPDGNRKYNERLARQRSTAVKGYLVWKYPYLDQYRIHPWPQGENWQELRRLIAGDEHLPNREKVLQIIDHTSDSDHCKSLLRKLDGGSSYRYIRERMLQYLRNAAVCLVWVKPDSLPALPRPVSPDAESLNKSCELLYPGMKSIRKQAQATFRNAQTKEKRPLFALKTNLLFDAALMPNVEIELPVGKHNRYSLNGELMFPWWLMDGDKYCLQILMGGLEGRYWLGNSKKRQTKEVLTGHFLGLYAGGGKYDLQWQDNGYQGEFFIAAGISYGYAHRIGGNLRLEYNIGIGLLRTDYQHYHARDNYRTLLWQENGKYTWFGPTKVKISLVWLLNRKVKTGKGGGR